MAIAAYVYVNADLLMPLKVMALVAVNIAGDMQPVGKYSLFRICREFVKGVAPEAWKLSNRLIT